MIRFVFTVFAILLPLFCSAEESFSGKVVSVADGDTIQVLQGTRAIKVRLWGVDAPEREQDFYSVSRQFTAENVFGKTVTVIVKERDQYGRSVGTVLFENALNLNHELVRAGLAWWYRHFAKDDQILPVLEQQARDAKRGLWSMPNPQAPWEFRRSHKHKNSP